MTEIRKIIAVFAALTLVFGLMPLPAFADDAIEGDAVPEAAATTEPADEEAESDLALEVQAEEPSSSSDGSDASQVDVSVLSFVYIESPTVAIDAVQNIVVGFVDEQLVVTDAQVELMDPDGQPVMLKKTEAVEGAALFSSEAGTLTPGVYSISSLRYRSADGSVFAVSFSDDEEVEYSFEVAEPSDESAEEGEVTTEVFTISTEGEYVETDSIAEAMAAAGVDPENGPESKQPAEGELTTQAADGFVIVLDPGHGGYDGGAGGNGLSENVVNLKIAQYCKAKLEQTPGVTVYMTRTNDTYVSLSDRVAFAKNHNADLVVSLHNNAGGGRGSEVIVPRNGSWYYDETYVTGNELGSKILSKLNALGLGTHSGVYSRDCTDGDTYPDGTLADYYALINGPREYGILGIIVEHAFIDNASDAAYLTGDANLKRLGEADAQAIIEYYNSSKGLDRLYWGVFDYDYYVSHYPDVKTKCGGSKVQALGYFKSTGMPAGHRGNALFDVNYYKAKYSDLQAAFGNNLPRYYQHFIEYGMKEGRQGSADFSPVAYKAAYSDLQIAFGSDWKKYYKHYVEYGIREGRSGTGAESTPAPAGSNAMYRMYNPYGGEHHYTAASSERDTLVRVGWRYEGVAWYAPSASSNPVFRMYNPYGGEHHYTTSGSERDALVKVGWRYEGVGWYSDEATGAPLYRMYNPYGGEHHYTASASERDSLKKVGWRYEGIGWYGVGGATNSSLAAVSNDESIMGSSQTSVAQMVRRYNSIGKSYPGGTYSKYGAANIEQFCQVLYEEATAEGVRPEVVFAQSMHETGWLQFGGDVKADQCNFAGIGATGGVPGNSFNDWGANSVRKGLRAQVQHLKAYASTDSCVNAIVDPRFSYVTRGCASTVRALGGKWATSASYGDALMSQIQALLKA